LGDAIRALLVSGDGPTAERIVGAVETESERITVRPVETIDRGLTRLDREPIDCVVTRSDLPDGDCLVLLDGVREEWPELPVLLYAADRSVVEEAIAAGATGYVPADDGVDTGVVLANRIANCVDRRRSWRPVERSSATDGGDAPGGGVAEPAWILDQLFAHIPTHLYVKDTDGRYLYVSGYHVDDPEAQLGRTDREIYPDPIGSEAYADDMRVIDTGDPIIEKQEYAAFQNEWNLTSKVPWYDRTGEVAGVVGVTRRITERKESQERLERQNERVEDLVEAVSHDLRNPLTVAQGRLELLREDCESDHLDAIERAHDRMETLVEDVLALAREGGAVTDVELVDLVEVSRRSWKTVATREASLDVETDRTIRADEQQLQQLFENLFRNAVEHAGTRVTVTVGALEDGFYVADDGPGIPEAERDRVFDRGYSTSEDSTGFGLSIVAQIADRNGWTVGASESDGGGARIEVTGIEDDG
jgi:signal transduction histidine kinase